MVDLSKLGRQAGDFLKSEKVQEALRSEKVERASDQVLEKTSEIASRLTKGRYDERIEEIKRQADKHLGNE